MLTPRAFVPLRSAALILCTASALFLSRRSFSSSPSSPDPLATEIARETAVVEALPDSDETLRQLREGATPALVRAGDALRAGRRMLALQRLAAAYPGVAAAEYLKSLPVAARSDVTAFEAEWKRRGLEFPARTMRPVEGLKPAAVRALAEAAFPQARIFYDASLEYGRSTMADSGLYYVGSARGQLAFVAFCRSLDEPAEGTAPRLRSLAPDIDALEKGLLAAYRPPASIDRHSDFIAGSAALKEAGELDAQGLRYGALLRLLQAALRLAPPSSEPPAPALIREKLDAARARFASDGLDHSLGRIFVESAAGDLESAEAKPGAAPVIAAAIVSEVLPRYFAALGPAPRETPRPDPVATITLVRWPYT